MLGAGLPEAAGAGAVMRAGERQDWTAYLERYGVTRHETQAHNVTYRTKLVLPWPPSVNHYWRHTPQGPKLSAEARAYRKAVYRAVMAHGAPRMAPGALQCRVTAFLPDRRRRDLDNIEKALWDALGHAGVYADDSDIWARYSRKVWDNNRRGEVDVWLKVIGT